jgi:hypothetical protein
MKMKPKRFIFMDRRRRGLLFRGERGRGNEMLCVVVILMRLIAKCHGVTGAIVLSV